jgi:hypothetical protein
MDKGKPIAGKLYSLTGGADTPSIANGNTWAESETKLYQVKLLKTDKSGGFFKTLQEALLKQKEYETRDWYTTIIRVDPENRKPLYDQDGWPIPV